MAFDNFEEFFLAYKLQAENGCYSWSALDRAIMGVCSARPLHEDVGEVYAKIRIINRAYLANLQFGTQDAEWKLAEKFVECKVDHIIESVRPISNLTIKSLPILLDAHEALVNIAHQVTKKVQNSFVSKYLHFHFPDAVPIFDSYAYDAAWKLAEPPQSQFVLYDHRLNRDYGYYCGSILQIMAILSDYGVESPNLKLLDVILYGSRKGPT